MSGKIGSTAIAPNSIYRNLFIMNGL